MIESDVVVRFLLARLAPVPVALHRDSRRGHHANDDVWRRDLAVKPILQTCQIASQTAPYAVGRWFEAGAIDCPYFRRWVTIT